ncbi:hypothetical protein BOX15_Mlig004430g1 [Macrostomum lignano]|uniref:Uncharacterized protein n=1 Tax=Macrostomum lignano TaxID=282301 RepID=A0A267DLT9_9PLAT|nr:hypothetical protein BOX15_Mlig004430g1 [Macrostomum lignano]
MAEKPAGDMARQSRQVEETNVVVPQFEELDTEGQQVFEISNALLNLNLEQLHANLDTRRAVQAATGELVHPPEQLLTAQPQAALNNSGSFGRNLLQIANEFARSRQADSTRQLAASIRLDSLNYESFHQQLKDLFEHGLSLEAFVTLFYFMACLLAKCFVEQGSEAFIQLGCKLLRWFLAYLLLELVRFATNYIRSLSSTERSSFLYGFVTGSAATAAVMLFGIHAYRNWL